MTPPPSLAVLHPDGTTAEVPLIGDVLIVGRAADAQLRLDHAMVSRHHAEIRRAPDGNWTLRDLGSRNGTLVNRHAIAQCVLADRDVLNVGPFEITVRLPRPHLRPQSQSTTLRVADAAPERIARLVDETGRATLRASHLLRLTEFSRRLLEVPQRAQRMTDLCDLMTRDPFLGTWAAIVRLPGAAPAAGADADQTLAPQLLCDARRPGIPDAHTYLSRTVLAAFRQQRQAVLGSNIPTAVVPLDLQISIAADGRGGIAAVACPLGSSSANAAHEGEAEDLLYVVFPPECGTGEWLALADLAARQYAQAESAWVARARAELAAAAERDLARGRQIQTRLLPAGINVPRLDVAIGFAPCRGVGGDYVDALPLQGGRLLATIADVCGKGLSAALVAQSLHTLVHSGLSAGLALPRLMSNINDYLRQSLADDMFVTMTAVVIDPATGELEYANAGHLLPLILTPGQPPRALTAADDLPLRVADLPMSSHPDRLDAGQTLVLYTDGLTELSIDATGTQLGVAGLTTELATACASADTCADDLARCLNARLSELQADREPTDDRTFIVIRRTA